MSDPVVAPFGSWRSPIGAELVALAATSVRECRIEGDAVWWLERRPGEGGRSALVRSDPWGGPADVTPAAIDVRTLVHEYGGGAYAVHGSTAFYTNYDDQRLYRQELGGEPAPITSAPALARSLRYADMDVSPDGRWIACVREVHEDDGLPENQLVVLPTDGSAEPRVMAAGADFYASPRFPAAGDRLAWVRWDMPRMPWDGTELLVAPFAAGELETAAPVAGGARESIEQPVWAPDGTLHFLSDRTGWWNLHRLELDGGATNLTPLDAEFGVPMWLFRYSSYAFLDDGRIACAYRRSGEHHLAMLDPATLELIDVDVPYECFDPPYVDASGGRVCFIGSGPATSPEVVLLDFASRAVDVRRPADDLGVDPDLVSTPEAIEFPTDDGRTAFAYFYPPRNPGFTGRPDELPPLVVHAHGGPTSETTP